MEVLNKASDWVLTRLKRPSGKAALMMMVSGILALGLGAAIHPLVQVGGALVGLVGLFHFVRMRLDDSK